MSSNVNSTCIQWRGLSVRIVCLSASWLTYWWSYSMDMQQGYMKYIDMINVCCVFRWMLCKIASIGHFSWHLQQQRPFRITNGCSDYGSEYTAEYNHRLLLRMSSITQKTKPRRHYFFNNIVTLVLCTIYVCKIR